MKAEGRRQKDEGRRQNRRTSGAVSGGVLVELIAQQNFHG
jgi:hypothetical protein